MLHNMVLYLLIQYSYVDIWADTVHYSTLGQIQYTGTDTIHWDRYGTLGQKRYTRTDTVQ